MLKIDKINIKNVRNKNKQTNLFVFGRVEGGEPHQLHHLHLLVALPLHLGRGEAFAGAKT